MIVYLCSECGHVLYRGWKLRTIDQIIKYYGGRCPCCLSELRKAPTRVEVEPTLRKPLPT